MCEICNSLWHGTTECPYLDNNPTFQSTGGFQIFTAPTDDKEE